MSDTSYTAKKRLLAGQLPRVSTEKTNTPLQRCSIEQEVPEAASSRDL